MKLLLLRVRGFGGLTPGEYRFTDRTLVVESNATGKSTLVAAVRAALYGLEADRRRQKGFTDHEAWRPWAGSEYGLALTVETRDGCFTVERDFSRAGGELAVRDGAGLDVTSTFLAGRGRDRVGERLTGVEEAAFLRAALAIDRSWGAFPGEEPGGNLADLLGSVVSSDEGGGPASAALAACDEALRHYDGAMLKGTGLVDTEIQRLEQRLREIRDDREATTARHEEALVELARLAELRESLAGLDAALAEVRRRRLRAQAAALARARKARLELEAELAAARESAAGAAHLRNFPVGREAELASLAERCAQADEEARAQRRRLDEALRPELILSESELAQIGEPGDGVTGDLAGGVGALLERRARWAQLRGERDALRERIVEEGEDLPLQEALRDGLARLSETERSFLGGQERLAFARIDLLARLDRDRRDTREAMAAWTAGARRHALGRGLAVALAGVALACVALALAPWPGGAPLPLPRWPAVAVAVPVACVAAALAFRLHRRRDALLRRRVLQGSARLSALAQEQKALDGREAARRQRLAELAPALLGAARARELIADPDDLAVLYGHHESFRIRHDAWFRLGERLQEEEAEIDRLRARLVPFLPAGGEDIAAGEDAGASGAAALLQKELARRLRREQLVERRARAREAIAAAERAAAEHATRAQQACHRAAGVLAILPADCRLPGPPAAAAEAVRVSEEIERLAASFRGDPAGVADWFAARAAEAANARRLLDETLPALERRLAEMPDPRETERRLAEVEGELALLAAAAGEADGARDAPPRELLTVDELVAKGEALLERRAALAAEIARLAGAVAEVEKERRAHLPELARRERELRGALGRAREFRAAVTLARDEIARLAGDVYARWAVQLDADAARLAAKLSPEIAGISFTPELDFTITLADGRRLEAARANRQLSSGARDQLMLAIRLALARFLARPGEPLPLVLDDPFARWDDARFARGMAALGEDAAGHQVILLTCQAQRLRWLHGADPAAAAGWTRLIVSRA